MKKIFILIISGFFLVRCASQKIISGNRNLARQFLDSRLADDHFTGIKIINASNEKLLLDYNSDKLFTPASNTKVVTFYITDKILKDSIPSIEYCICNDSLFFSGLADPTFLHPDFEDQASFTFLRNYPGKLVYVPTAMADKKFGPGWAWDDYPFYFQPEKSTFPLYGNCLWVSKDTTYNKLKIIPDLFEIVHIHSEDSTETNEINRNERLNEFQFTYHKIPDSVDEVVPFISSDTLVIDLLEDTLHVCVPSGNFPVTCEKKVIYSYPKDSVFRKLLVESDNFIAEQLALSGSYQIFGIFDSDSLLSYEMKKYFPGWKDKIKWRDGSGLSRYNMMSPEFLTWLLTKIYRENDWDRIVSLFPDGGREGTLKGLHQSTKPYIFAKSGSMTGVYNLSGYLLTDNGNTLIFSFMNNNFNRPVRDIRSEVEDYLLLIKKNY